MKRGELKRRSQKKRKIKPVVCTVNVQTALTIIINSLLELHVVNMACYSERELLFL